MGIGYWEKPSARQAPQNKVETRLVSKEQKRGLFIKVPVTGRAWSTPWLNLCYSVMGGTLMPWAHLCM